MPVAGGSHRGGPPAWPRLPPDAAENHGPPWRRQSKDEAPGGAQQPAMNITLKAVKKPNTAGAKQQSVDQPAPPPAAQPQPQPQHVQPQPQPQPQHVQPQPQPVPVEQPVRRRPAPKKQESVAVAVEPPVTVVEAPKSSSRPKLTPLKTKAQENGIAPPPPPPVSIPPPPPPAPPMAPPPPPPPPMEIRNKKPLAPNASGKLEELRKVPRKRPDWGAALKEIENKDKRTMKHVITDDRSKPIISSTKTGNKFCYESEKPKPNSVHNALLNQIQHGIHLKKVKTNDRSTPNLKGLRKLRRQQTVDDMLKRAMSIDEGGETPPIPDADEVVDDDDIDKIRDDLQSTKQLLEQETKMRQRAERDKLGLELRVSDLEDELKKMRKQLAEMKNKEQEETTTTKQQEPQRQPQQSAPSEPSSNWEGKFKDASKELAVATAKMEDAEQRAIMLQKKLEKLLSEKGLDMNDINEIKSSQIIPKDEEVKPPAPQVEPQPEITPQPSVEEEEEESTETETETESSEEENEEDLAEKQRKKEAREKQLLANKLRSVREKQVMARKERTALKAQLRNLRKAHVNEQKKYRALEKELQRIASVAKMPGDDDNEDERSDSSSSEEESSSDDEEEEVERVANVPESMEQQIKRLESALSAKKKGNFLLKAQSEKLKSHLEQERDKYKGLEEELNCVLSEIN